MTSVDKSALKALRQRAHALRPVVRLGQHGLTEAVLAELDIALAHHELVKVKLAAEDGPARAAQLQGLLDGTAAMLVQRIGHTATLYRQRPPQPPARSRARSSAGSSARPRAKPRSGTSRGPRKPAARGTRSVR